MLVAVVLVVRLSLDGVLFVLEVLVVEEVEVLVIVLHLVLINLDSKEKMD
jgi:hypothetical protein